MTRKRTDTIKRTQAEYEAERLATGATIQINTKLKAAGDVAMMLRLRGRFPDMKDSAIVRMALRLIDGASNKPEKVLHPTRPAKARKAAKR